jgi:hypothetical protein
MLSDAVPRPAAAKSSLLSLPVPRNGMRPFGWIVLALLAAAPVVHILAMSSEAARNIVYWDEFDTALAFVLRLHDGVGAADFFRDLFSVNNEHRMVTSRFMFAVGYWLTGTVNFAVLSAIGNASLVALCILLVAGAGTPARRLRLGLPLAFLLFQLEHYENFFWSGSSIDHFQVLLLAGGAVTGLARGTRGGLVVGTLCALLAGFTLAHGMLVWPLGAAILASRRRWRDLAVWLVAGTAAIGLFVSGFRSNQAHHFAALSVQGLASIGHYWLSLLGAVPVLGHAKLAPWSGAALLGLLGWLAARGAFRREPVALPLALFAVGSLALIAVGRAEESGGVLHSRYLVLGALAWALAIFMVLERWSHPRRPFMLLIPALPVLAAFNLAANHAFAASADSWIECRDRAASRFKQHGADGLGPFKLYPVPARSTQLLQEAERRGVYRMPPVSEPRSYPDAKPSPRITYFVDEMTVDRQAAFVAGWAAIPKHIVKRGTVHLVLQDGNRRYVFTTVTVSRPDVVHATRETGWLHAGFRFARRRDNLPEGLFQIGFLIENSQGGEYIMTAHHVDLRGPGKALLATGD